MKKLFLFLEKRMFLPLIALSFLIIAFIVDSPQKIFNGYGKILTSSSILVTDYVALGGIGATLLNVSIILSLNILMVGLLKLRISGPIFAGLLAITGFSFFGKNILNTIPLYLGIYLYSLKNKIPFKSSIIAILFSTGISPIVSYAIFGMKLEYYFSIPLGIVIGIIIGFCLPSISSNTIKLHGGYNLFNIGFALGIISLAFTAIFRAFKVDVSTELIISDQYHWLLWGILVSISLFFIIVAMIGNMKGLKNYPKLLKRTGRLITDFIRDNGWEVTLFNVGIMGIICSAVVLITQMTMNGPILGVILTVVGFSAYGIHPKNAIPLMLGAIICAILMKADFNNVGVAMAIFLVMGISPIAGTYGFIIGVIIGAMHMAIVSSPYMVMLQGGFDLYNNGFAAGFVGALVVPVLEMFKEE